MRNSDRWITPAVIVSLIFVAGVVVLGLAAGMVFLAARGVDPDPILRFVVEVTGTLGILVNVVLTMAGRSTQAKTERNTGVLAGRVGELAEAVEPPARHAYAETRMQRSAPPPPPGRVPA